MRHQRSNEPTPSPDADLRILQTYETSTDALGPSSFGPSEGLLCRWRTQRDRTCRLNPGPRLSPRTTPGPRLLDAPRPSVPRQPVFVGGTGRSGTKILGELLRRSTAYTLVELELHFHADRGGLADVLAGRIDVSYFVQRMRGFWYRRPSPYGDSRGLFWLVPEARLDAMLQRFPDAFERDRARACASLLDEVVENHPVAEGRAWIERTPANSQAAPWLLSMFPQAAVINIVRSGLDVAHR